MTDPPYNVDYESSDGKKIENDNMEESQFILFLTNVFKNINNYMKDGASFYIWHADWEGISFRNAVRDTGWDVKQCLIWNKKHFTLGRQDYQWKHEPCLYGWKGGAGHYFSPRRDLSTIIEKKIDIDELEETEMREMLHTFLDGELPLTVINENKPLRSAEHPTMKPVSIIGNLIRNSSKKHDIVLDTFGGSGTTLIACEQLNRKCRMMELDPHYCDVIIARWEQFTGNKVVKLNE